MSPAAASVFIIEMSGFLVDGWKITVESKEDGLLLQVITPNKTKLSGTDT